MAATIDKDLANALKAVRGGKAMQFALLPKGAEGKLLVGKKIAPQQIAETKKATGASAVFKGRCVGEEGTLVFEVAKEPPATLLGQLKKCLKADAGLTVPVEIRVKSDAEEELPEAEAEAAEGAAAAGVKEAEPAAASDPAAEWKAKLAEWTPAIKAALAAKGPNAAAIGKLLAQANALAKPGGDMAEALARLTECHALAAPPSTPENGRAKWEAALAGIEPAYLQGLRDRPDDASKLRAVMGFAQDKAEKEDFPGAIAALQKLAQHQNMAPAAAGGDPAAEWKKNLAAWTPAIKAALAAKGPNAADIGKLLAQANALAKPGGDMAQALANLTECHKLATAGAAPAAPAAVSNVVFTQTRLAWDATRKKIQSELTMLVKSIRDTVKSLNENPDATEEIDPSELEKGLEKLRVILEKLDERLIDRLDEALNAADPAARRAKHQEAKVIVGEYLAYVNSDPLMAIIDNNGFTPTKIRATAEAALKMLSGKL